MYLSTYTEKLLLKICIDQFRQKKLEILPYGNVFYDINVL